MAELFPLADISDTPDPYKAYKGASPQTILAKDGNPAVLVYNARTDFQALDKAHKAHFVPKTGSDSSYAQYLPDISGLPKPGAVLDEQERQRIITEGVIPEVLPFMTGTRIALADRQAKRQHRKAQRLLRRIHVAHNAAEYIVDNEDYTSPENEFPPTTLRDLAAVKRMGRLVRRARSFHTLANTTEEAYTPPGKTEADFEGDKERQSIFERRQRWSADKLHKRRHEKASRLLVGRKLPLTDKRVGLFSFEGLAAGGPGTSLDKVERALAKRDIAILKQQALKEAVKGRGEKAQYKQQRRQSTRRPSAASRPQRPTNTSESDNKDVFPVFLTRRETLARKRVVREEEKVRRHTATGNTEQAERAHRRLEKSRGKVVRIQQTRGKRLP